MLEVKNLAKHYSTKGGVTVKALDDVSVKFPETGMVFLLGRSGSGKSTLLNVAGGLDKPDSGEVIVKGKSSKDFSTSDFDSYRNTFVGFVFQEYNILNEFTVEQNIALALQLQNKPNDKKAVEALLEQVDLKGLGKRKPNTLSGGQKQRVAIARALIKEPEIIMADEPTGALDSNTGKQVLETLKKLSETKLVVVVSHDKEFAEFYGDRIIELCDGKIISDVEKAYSEPKDVSQNVRIISDDTISIKNAENITEADVKNIVAILKKNKGEAIISAGKREMPEIKRACKINEDGNREYFKDTTDVKIKEYDGSKTKFIKSKLPTSHAFKMGASGLKTKPIRLIFTILLSVVAFLMFGVVSTLTLYDETYSISEALKESDYPSFTVGKYYSAIRQNIKINNKTGEEKVDYEYEQQYQTRFGESELAQKNASGYSDYAGIFDLTDNAYMSTQSYTLSVKVENNSYKSPTIKDELKYYYPVHNFIGFTDCGAEYMSRNGFTLIGNSRYPKDATEIAIPEYIANLFVNADNFTINYPQELIGTKVAINNCTALGGDMFTIVGIYNVGSIPSKYDELKDANSTNLSDKDRQMLIASLSDYISCSFNNIIYVHEDFYESYKHNIASNKGTNIYADYYRGLRISAWEITENPEDWWGVSAFTQEDISRYEGSFEFFGLDGNTKTFSLSENQIYAPYYWYSDAKNQIVREYAYKVQNLFSRFARDKADSIVGEGTAFDDLLNYGYVSSDSTVITSVIDEWYTTLKTREYVFDAMDAMIRTSDNLADGRYEGGVLRETYYKIYDYVWGYNPDAPVPTDADWQLIINEVLGTGSDFKDYSPQKYYYFFASVFSEKLWEDETLAQKIEGEFATLVGEDVRFVDIWSRLGADNCSDQEFSAIKQILNKYYSQVVGEPMEVSELLKVKYIVDIGDYYYKNNKGDSGMLEVVGYFKINGSDSGECLVHSDFINRYADFSYLDEYEYSWKEVEKTDYVAPTDVKYNYIISRTDNTREEITNALSSSDSAVSYGFTNRVYEQLKSFVNTINDLKQVFLIVGCVFGVFAALMLLNFISVSISAKKRDIGILRAVGARGSDVFKIFFAEAFMIATICFILATIGAYIVSGIINDGAVSLVSMKLLNFSVVNALLILVIAFGISALATFFPVRNASKKSPVESIRSI